MLRDLPAGVDVQRAAGAAERETAEKIETRQFARKQDGITEDQRAGGDVESGDGNKMMTWILQAGRHAAFHLILSWKQTSLVPAEGSFPFTHPNCPVASIQ